MPQRVPSYRAPYLPSTRKVDQRRYDRTPQRKADHAFYCSAPWVTLRLLVLSEEPLCWWCLRETPSRTVAATTVHHVIERKYRPDLELDRDNLHSACASCHSRHHASKGKRHGQ